MKLRAVRTAFFPVTLAAVFLAVLAARCAFCADNARTYTWKKGGSVLKLTDAYGTSAGETIRAQNQRERAYHIFNTLCASKQDFYLHIDLAKRPVSAGDRPFRYGSAEYENARYNITKVSSFKTCEIAQETGIDMSATEEAVPYLDDGKLYYLRWGAGTLDIESEGAPVYSDSEVYNFYGKRGQNLIIRKSGRLKFLSEIDWLDVESLKGYWVLWMKWIDGEHIAAYTESISGGKRYLAVASVRIPEARFIPEPPGKLLDASVSPDGKKVFALTFESGYWRIMRLEEAGWRTVKEYERRIFLLGIRNGSLLWWDREKKEIVTDGGDRMELADFMDFRMLPQGEYYTGREENSMRKSEPGYVYVLLYDKKSVKELEAAGLGRKDKFDSIPEIWLFDKNYRTSFERLPKDMGSVCLSPGDLKIYYDTFGMNGLRTVKSIKARPAVSGRRIIVVLIFTLVILIMNDIFKKTKEFTK
ncbi:MAG: hypothetical protein JXJ19_02595 [Elusimicrobia bacterium]|nr:hypothetical protein [Elusimicrobiota bacterium]